MMRKLVALMMALCLVLTAAAAFAEEEDVTVVNWADYEADAAQVEGELARIAETGLVMFVPAEFKDSEISEEAGASGIFMVLKDEKEEKAVVNAQLVETDISTFATALAEQGMMVRVMKINGLNGIQFSVPSEDVVTISFAFGTDAGTTLVFSMSNADQEPFTSLYKLMAASIQAAE